MCKDTENLTLSKWREVYFSAIDKTIILDTQDGVWHIQNVTRQTIEEHIFQHGYEGIDYQYGSVCEWDSDEGRSFIESVKQLTCDIEEWLDHYVETHHSDLLEIPE